MKLRIASIFLVMFSVSAQSQYQAQEKSFALLGCEKKKAAAVTESERERVISVCKCMVEATDYEEINNSLQTGSLDLQKLQASANENLRKCEVKVGETIGK